MYYGVPIPYLNIAVALCMGLIGVVYAFLKINERPMDVWVRNFIKKLFTPSQFYYMKKNEPPSFLTDIPPQPQEITTTQIIARNKLSSYLESQKKAEKQPRPTLKQTTTLRQSGEPPKKNKTDEIKQTPTTNAPSQPFLFGTVRNSKHVALPNILVYIKTTSGTVRLLKTNVHGVFATFHTLATGEYSLEAKDPKGVYFFDTMDIKIDDQPQKPLDIVSKELI